jgi:hypothetical protein
MEENKKLSDISDDRIKEIIKNHIYEHLSKVDYEIRGKYDVIGAIKYGLNDAFDNNLSDNRIKEIIKDNIYEYLKMVDYEIRSKYDISDAIEDGLDNAFNELQKF